MAPEFDIAVKFNGTPEQADKLTRRLGEVPGVTHATLTPTEPLSASFSPDTVIETGEHYSLKDLSRIVSLSRAMPGESGEPGVGPVGIPKEERYGDVNIRLLFKEVGRSVINNNRVAFSNVKKTDGENRYNSGQAQVMLDYIKRLIDQPRRRRAFSDAGITIEVLERAEELIRTTPKDELLQRYLDLVGAAAKKR